MINSCFLFGDEHDFTPAGPLFRMRIPEGVRDKTELLRIWRVQCQFPGYAGENWDAFAECLTDLSWIKEEVVFVVHDDFPLKDDQGEQRIYIDVLNQAALDWQQAPAERNGDKTRHSLFFLFPVREKHKVRRALEAVE